MDKQLFAEYSDYTRKALVMASIGKYSEYQHLSKIFKDSMEQGAEMRRQLNVNAECEQPLFSISELQSDKYTPTSIKDKNISRTKKNDLDL